MGVQFSVTACNDQLDQLEDTIGTSPVLEIRSGPPPAACATAASGTLLSSLTLPSDWMSAASSASKAKLGTWSQASAAANGYAGYFRIKSSGGTCHVQGNCGQTWTISTAYVVGQQVVNGSKCYKCTTAGTSAGSGGPTGTSTGITDGTCVWDYVGTADMTLDNTNIVAGQSVTVNSFTLTNPNT